MILFGNLICEHVFPKFSRKCFMSNYPFRKHSKWVLFSSSLRGETLTMLSLDDDSLKRASRFLLALHFNSLFHHQAGSNYPMFILLRMPAYDRL